MPPARATSCNPAAFRRRSIAKRGPSRPATASPASPPAPGTEGRLVWRDPRPQLAAEYILRRNGRLGVFLIEGDRARFHELALAQEGRPASADFSPEARIATRGRHALQDGMAVVVDGATPGK